jgi:hypothetical protein
MSGHLLLQQHDGDQLLNCSTRRQLAQQMHCANTISLRTFKQPLFSGNWLLPDTNFTQASAVDGVRLRVALKSDRAVTAF